MPGLEHLEPLEVVDPRSRSRSGDQLDLDPSPQGIDQMSQVDLVTGPGQPDRAQTVGAEMSEDHGREYDR